MLDKYLFWQYRDDNNCWDFVRSFLFDFCGIKLKKYGIAPDDKESMTKESVEVAKDFFTSGPVDFAIACHYYRETILHVGIVYKGQVWHTSKRRGTCIDSIEKFESQAKTTVYKLHGNIANSR